MRDGEGAEEWKGGCEEAEEAQEGAEAGVCRRACEKEEEGRIQEGGVEARARGGETDIGVWEIEIGDACMSGVGTLTEVGVCANKEGLQE